LSILCFGIENIKQNIFENFSADDDILSQFVRIIFLVIFLCALPFNIYPVKLCVLNFIEEVRSKRISQDLEASLKENGKSSKSIEDEVSYELHTCVALSLLVLLSVCSLLVDDLRVVFGIIGTFSEAIINFILPGIFLMVTEYKMKTTNWLLIFVGFALSAFGTIYFFTSNYYTLMKLLS
jgi:hypothetical protein